MFVALNLLNSTWALLATLVNKFRIKQMPMYMIFSERSSFYTERITKLRSSVLSKSSTEIPPLWSLIPVSQWSTHEITGWFLDTAGHLDIAGDDKEVLLDDLAGRTGSDLYGLSCQEFANLSQRYGEKLYHCLHRIQYGTSSEIR